MHFSPKLLRIAMAGWLALAALCCGQTRAGDLPTHYVRVLPASNDIEFLGEMNVGSADDLAEVLASHPYARLIHLNSPGGEVAEAHRMVRMVGSRHMTTVVDKLCASACTLVFLAGTERIIAPGTKLGFHSFWAPGISQTELAQLMRTDRDFMAAAGVKPAFIDKAFAVSSDSVWFPEDDELKAAGVVTQITAKYAITVGDYRSTSEERETLISEILEAIKTQNPQDYAVIHADQLQQIEYDTPASESASAADELYSRYLNKFMAHASDSMAAQYLRTFVAMVSEIGVKNPEACYRMLITRQSLWESGAARFVSSGRREDLEMTLLRTAVDGIRLNRPIPSESDSDEGWELVSRKFIEKHPSDLAVLIKINSPSVDRAAACRAELAFYDAMVSLPESYLGTLARGVAAEKAHEAPGSGESLVARQFLQSGRPNGK